MFHPAGYNFLSCWTGYSNMLFLVVFSNYAVVLQFKICSVIHSYCNDTCQCRLGVLKCYKFWRKKTSKQHYLACQAHFLYVFRCFCMFLARGFRWNWTSNLAGTFGVYLSGCRHSRTLKDRVYRLDTVLSSHDRILPRWRDSKLQLLNTGWTQC